MPKCQNTKDNKKKTCSPITIEATKKNHRAILIEKQMHIINLVPSIGSCHLRCGKRGRCIFWNPGWLIGGSWFHRFLSVCSTYHTIIYLCMSSPAPVKTKFIRVIADQLIKLSTHFLSTRVLHPQGVAVFPERREDCLMASTWSAWIHGSHRKRNALTFQYIGCFVGILIMVYCNPHTTGYYNQIYTPNDQDVFHCSGEQTQLVFVHQYFSQSQGVVRCKIFKHMSTIVWVRLCGIKVGQVGSKFRCNETIQPYGWACCSGRHNFRKKNTVILIYFGHGSRWLWILRMRTIVMPQLKFCLEPFPWFNTIRVCEHLTKHMEAHHLHICLRVIRIKGWWHVHIHFLIFPAKPLFVLARSVTSDKWW